MLIDHGYNNYPLWKKELVSFLDIVKMENKFSWLPPLLQYAHKQKASHIVPIFENGPGNIRDSEISQDSIRRMLRSRKSTRAPTYLSRHTHLFGPKSNISKHRKAGDKISNETGRPTIQKQHHSRVIMESKPGLKKHATLHHKKKKNNSSLTTTSLCRAETIDIHGRYSHGRTDSPLADEEMTKKRKKSQKKRIKVVSFMNDLETTTKKEECSKELEEAIEEDDESLNASFEEAINDLFTELSHEMGDPLNYFPKIFNFFIKRIGADYLKSKKGEDPKPLTV